MNGQADAAARRAAEAAQWRDEVTDELALYTRHGEDAAKVIAGWIRNVNEDIEHDERELWAKRIERSRLVAYQRTLQVEPVNTNGGG